MKRHSFIWFLTMIAMVAFPWMAVNANTLAILPFENNSITDRTLYEPLSKGLSAMLISDLAGNTNLKLIERSRIQALLKEVTLGQSTGLSDASAIEAGKMLGAQNIAFGSFVVLGPMVRIDTRIIDVETSELVMAESVDGNATDFLKLEKGLAQKIAAALNSTMTDQAMEANGSIEAALTFSKGLDSLDAGNQGEAELFFAEAVKLDASYSGRVAQLAARDGSNHNNADRVVEAEGFSMKSKNDAITEAQRAAVEQAMGVLVSSETEMADFQIKKDKVISRSQGYITRFDVISEEKSQDNIYIVKIRATVSLSKIQDDMIAMQILLDNLDRPSVMVLIEEEYLSMDNLNLNLAEAEVTSLLNAKGFDLVDQAQVERIRATEQQRQAMAGNTAAAQALGLQAGAQYVVLGKAVVQNNGEAFVGSAMKSMQSSMQLRVLQTQSGMILGSVVRTGVAAHVSPVTGATQALQASARESVNEYVANTITEAFQDFVNNGAPLKMTISNLASFSSARKFSSQVEELDGVVSVKQDGWIANGGLLMLDLRYRGNTSDIAELLDGMQVGSQTLQISDLAPDRLSVVLQ